VISLLKQAAARAAAQSIKIAVMKPIAVPASLAAMISSAAKDKLRQVDDQVEAVRAQQPQ
jgi:hypothetical protein